MARDRVVALRNPPPKGGDRSPTLSPGPTREGDLVTLYLSDLGQFPALTKDDEVRLAQAIERADEARRELERQGETLPAAQQRDLRRDVKAGDDAERTLVQSNLRLVISIASKYQTSNWPTRLEPAWWPRRVSSAARVRVDFSVQRNGDMGSLLLSGSTNESSATSSSGFKSIAFLRPAPGRRTRSERVAPPASSLAPAISVLRLIPVAAATLAWPPRPSISTNAAPNSRRSRSSRSGAVTSKNRLIPSSLTSTPPS